MSSPDEFSEKLYDAAEKKILWFDSVSLPKVLEGYRNYHSLVENMILVLQKKGLIDPDPYKLEKSIADIMIPDSSDFSDNDRAAVLGTRLSEYERSLDFLCNYIKFSVESLSIVRIKKLVLLNTFIMWNSLSSATSKSNSRVLGNILASVKAGSDTLSTGLLSNTISVSLKTLAMINASLKELAEFQKELYKIEVRKEILDSPSFASERELLTTESGVARIKKVFPSLMAKNAFYTELIEELIQEEVGQDSEFRQQALLDKFNVAEQKSEKKEVKVDTKDMLLNSVRALSAFSPQFDVVIKKIDENHNLLQNERQSGWDKFISACRKTFGLPEKPVHYKIKIVEPLTQSTKAEHIECLKFLNSLSGSSRLYAGLSVKASASYKKIEAMPDDAILEYVQKKISESQSLYVTLVGLDDFFKVEVTSANRQRVKGLKMELTAIKNTIVKVNQHKAEYVALIAEQEQLKKLGITNE